MKDLNFNPIRCDDEDDSDDFDNDDDSDGFDDEE